MFILIILAYSNTLTASWHFDDMHNIVENPNIQIKSISSENIKKIFYSNRNTPNQLYRPLSCLTFALNAYLGETKEIGYHIFNIMIHAACSALLIYMFYLIFKTPALEDTQEDEKVFITVFASLLWAINPIQTQAVTYIVQRMAILCSFFTIISIIFYLRARLSKQKSAKVYNYTISAIGLLFSVLSKENGVVSPLLIFLFEYILFRGGNPAQLKNKYILQGFVTLIAISLALHYLLGFNLAAYLNYNERPFNLFERLLTQPRVIVYYLSQIFYPLPERLSIEHDIIISTGLFTPISTFISICMVTGLLFIGLLFKSVHPLIRISILFFFGAHVVESTFLPLELVFEHRNYLPSILIFSPIGILFYRLIKIYSSHKKYMKALISIFLIAIFVLFTIGTYVRNYDWASEKSIWADAIIKAPNSARAKHNLALMLENNGNEEAAFILYKEALNGFYYNTTYKADTYINIGRLYMKRGDYQMAHLSWDKAIELNPNFGNAYLLKTDAYIQKREWGNALSLLTNIVFRKAPDDFAANKFAAICHINLGNYNNALLYLSKCIKKEPMDSEVFLNIAEAMSLSGYHQRADFFYREAISLRPNDPTPFIGMAKNNFLHGDMIKSKKDLKNFFRVVGIENVKKEIELINTQHQIPLISIKKMYDFINLEFEKYKIGINAF